MINRLKKTIFTSVILATGILTALPVQADFDEKQREEIGQIVRDYLLKNPELLQEVIVELERKQQEEQMIAAREAISENAAAIFQSEDDLVAGNPEGSVTMVEFFDYNCGFCKRSLPDVLALIENDKDLRVVMKEFPILGPGSTYAARAAMASRKQGKYWEFHLALMEHQGAVDEAAVRQIAERIGLDTTKLAADMDAPEISRTIQNNLNLAQTLGIQGTPAFIIDQTLVPGAVGVEELFAAIESVRENGGCKVC